MVENARRQNLMPMANHVRKRALLDNSLADSSLEPKADAEGELALAVSVGVLAVGTGGKQFGIRDSSSGGSIAQG